MLTRMLQRRGTSAQWTDVEDSVILQPGEVGFETDTNKFKVGDGTSLWSNLDYFRNDGDNAGIYSKLLATQTFTGSQTLVSDVHTSIPLVIRGTTSGGTSQSVALQQWKNASGSVVADINPNGKITAAGGNFTADVDMNSHKISGVGAPTDPSDATNKQYVDDAIAGLAWKESVNLAALANVALNGNTNTLILDGHAALTQAHGNGYRILLLSQTDVAENGIYVYSDNGTTYQLDRAADADSLVELAGASVFIQEGDTYGTSSWVQTNHYLNTFADQQWVQFNGASQITAGDGIEKDGNRLDVVVGNGLTISLDAVSVAPSGIVTDMIDDEAVTDVKIAANAIAQSNMKDNSVGTAELIDLNVTNAKLADDAVTNAKLADNSVALANMQNDSVGESEIIDGSVTSAKIANNTIVNDDISSSAAISQSKIDGLVSDLAGKASTSHSHTLNSLSDVDTTGAIESDTLIFDGSSWVPGAGGGSGASITVSDTEPTQKSNGSLWFNSSSASLFVYYTDGTSGQWVGIVGPQGTSGALLPYEINAQTGTSYTLATSDMGKLITMNNANAITLTVPQNSVVSIPVGTQIAFTQMGAGQITVAGSGLATIRSATTFKTRSQYSTCSLVKVAYNEWLLLGDLAVF